MHEHSVSERWYQIRIVVFAEAEMRGLRYRDTAPVYITDIAQCSVVGRWGQLFLTLNADASVHLLFKDAATRTEAVADVFSF